jgi:CheY-like chemotaxis protein
LTAKGHDVVVCPNGKLALEQMISKVPDLIFCDLVMPEMDGYQFTKQALHLNKQLKIIILSAQPEEKAKPELMRLGAIDYYQKPIKKEALDLILKRYVKQVSTIEVKPEILPAPDNQPFETHLKSCYICGSEQVRVQVPKKQAYSIDWDNGFFPTFTAKPGFNQWDFLRSFVHVCPSCMFASSDPNDFAYRGQTEKFPYKLDAKKILTLSISTRKRIVNPEGDIEEDHQFDHPHRNLNQVLAALLLAEKCANGLVLGDKLGAYAEIGYYYMMQGVIDRINIKQKFRAALNSFLDQLKVKATPRDTTIKCYYFSIVLYLALGESIKANEQKEHLEHFYKDFDPEDASEDERRWNQRLLHVWQNGVDINSVRILEH